jgi:TolB-like protein/lipoprotein NlpI
VTDAPTEREGEGAWTKLRRRKVVQWGIAYAAAAWTLLQVLEYFGETYAWPLAVRQIAGLALPLGLLFVLVVAWYHGDKGDQRVSRPELAILATIVAFVGGTLWWYVSRIDESAWVVDTGVSETRHAVQADAASIAVLPFVNMSPDKDQEYFADGISEELRNLLAQVPELRVIARTSSFSFKGKEVDVATIAETLNVANVLEGSVRKSGNTLRITAQLIRTSDSSHLWSETYDRPMTDVFKVQDEIAAAVVEQLKLKLLGAPPKAQTTDPEAFALLMQARHFMRQGTDEGLEQSLASYQQALAIDPGYAAAWSGLAFVYFLQALSDPPRRDEDYVLAREAVGKALALDPDCADAHWVLGTLALGERHDLAMGARHFTRALALDPASSDILRSASYLARNLGRYEEAIAIGKYAIARDPVSSLAHFNLGVVYQGAGHYDEAIESMRTALRLSPGRLYAHAAIGESLLLKGEGEAALAEMKLEPDESSRLGGLAMAQYALGHRAESDAALRELTDKYGQDEPNAIAWVLAFRGEADHAFEWLERAFQSRTPGLHRMVGNRLFDNLHDDPRWVPFLRRVGAAPEQLEAIKFDVTAPK